MLKRMKLNVRIDPALHLEVKRYALEHGTTFSAFLREALEEKLALSELQPEVSSSNEAKPLDIGELDEADTRP